MPLPLRLEGVTKSYGAYKALDGVSLEILPGQIVALLGPNGAGKSTLISCLAGLVRPEQGSILYDGQPFARENLELRRRLGYVPDLPPIFGNLTVLYYVGLVVRLYERDDEEGLVERAAQLLEDFDLLPLAGRPLQELSRGQVYKTALCGLLAVDPDVWILDEPFASGMDPAGLLAFKDQARAAAARGRTVLFSTQLLEAAERFADRVCILDRGAVRAFGPIQELAARSGDLEAFFRRLREPL